MVRLLPITPRKCIKKLRKARFSKTHQRGSHAYYSNKVLPVFIMSKVKGSK